MKITGRYFIYILECADGSYYTGVTNDLQLRFQQHIDGIDPRCYTFRRRPLRLVYEEWFHDINVAIEREKQIKRWSRAKKAALIAGEVDALHFQAMSTAKKAKGRKEK